MVSMIQAAHHRKVLNSRVSQTNTNDRVRGTRRQGRVAGNRRPQAPANEIMVELISLGGKAEKAVKCYPAFTLLVVIQELTQVLRTLDLQKEGNV